MSPCGGKNFVQQKLLPDFSAKLLLPCGFCLYAFLSADPTTIKLVLLARHVRSYRLIGFPQQSEFREDLLVDVITINQVIMGIKKPLRITQQNAAISLCYLDNRWQPIK